jgi:fatty acid desaturase
MYNVLNNIVHLIFAMKYWVMSNKIEQIVSKKENNKADLIANFIFYFITLLIVATNIAACFDESPNSGFSSSGEIIFNVLYSMPPYLIVGVLIDAFYRLRKFKGD